tara:strand:+ start:45 stop:743 length:699 start_codon:yes stop_codon:yes gene_type:complete
VPKKKKAKKKMYFGQEVEDAIIKYNDTDSHVLKNKIYQEEIHAAFDKLCENIINTFKFEYFDDVYLDVKTEVISFLVLNMHKYDHTKGSKAFSYFSVVAKNYLILHNNANYKKYKMHTNVDILNNKVVGKGSQNYFSDFTEEIIEYFDKNIPKLFKTERDINVAFSVIELLKKRDDIENFNKKALYVLIREMTNIETSYITKVVNVLKKEYRILQNNYEKYGIVFKNKSKFF